MEEKEKSLNAEQEAAQEETTPDQTQEEQEAVDQAQEEQEAVDQAQEEAQDCQDVPENEDTSETAKNEETEEEMKSGFFSRKKKDKKDEQIEELKDRVTRQMAEFDNFRKRTEKEKAAMFEVGAKSVIEKILPVVDNFERGLEAAGEDSEDPFVVGMQKIYKQLMTTLEAMEVKPIEAVGKEFDPDFHNAVLHVEDENLGENVIAAELQKGYMYRDSVVRHSMVTVAN